VGHGSDDPESIAILQLPALPESAASGRRFIAKTLAGWGLAGLSDTAVLLGNELITNALVHAGSAVEVRLVRRRSTLRVAVRDTSGGMPVRRFYSLEARSGRGLAMVEALATRWGVTPLSAGGKTVWFELPSPDGNGRLPLMADLGHVRPAGAAATD